MIASIAFRNFKALRNTSLALAPFNLLVGPNGSGKSSLIQALLRLRTLAKLPLKAPTAAADLVPHAPRISLRFHSPYEGVEAVMSCVSDLQCDLLELVAPTGPVVPAAWAALRARLLGIRAYLFDHYAIALPAPRHDRLRLSSNGGNLAAVLERCQEEQRPAFDGLRASLLRMLPEYRDVRAVSRDGATVEVELQLVEEGRWVAAEHLSQGTLYALALCLLAHEPDPPAVLCIEEVDRGIHPRLLREVRDVLYRLSHPQSQGVQREPVQVIATTHSPYLLDLFRDHPEEVVIAEKHGATATFARLADQPRLSELLAEGSLGDMWFSGILGGVPEEPE